MALKDWKKVGINKMLVTYMNKNDTSKIIHIRTIVTTKKSKLVIEKYETLINWKYINDFKTKPQALAYAKSYMRKN